MLAWIIALVVGSSPGLTAETQEQVDPITKQLHEFMVRDPIPPVEFDQTYERMIKEGTAIPEAARANFNILKLYYAARHQSAQEFMSVLALITKEVPLHRKASGYRWIANACLFRFNLLGRTDLDRHMVELLQGETRPFYKARFGFVRAIMSARADLSSSEIIRLSREAIRLLDELNPPQTEFFQTMYFDLFSQLAMLLQTMTKYTEALTTLNEALSRILKMPTSALIERSMYATHLGIATNYHYLGDLSAARRHYEICIKNFAKMYLSQAGMAVSSYVLLLANLREFEEAERQLKLWIPAAMFAQEWESAMFLHVVQLYVQWRQNDMAGLAVAHRAIIKLGESHPDFVDYAYHAGDAFAQTFLNPTPKALESAKKAEALLAQGPYSKHRAIVQSIRGRAELELGLYEDANKTLAELEREFQRMSEDVSDPSEVGLFQQTLPHLHGHIALLHHKRNKSNEALFALERGRGWGIARQSRLNYAVQQSDILTEDQRRQLSQAEEGVRRAQGQFRVLRESTKPALDALKTAEEQVVAARGKLKNAWEKIYLVNDDLRQKSKNIDLVFQERELNALLNKHPDTLFVHFACVDERESLAVITAKGISTRTQTIKVGEGDMIKKARAYLVAMGAGPGRAGSATPERATPANEHALAKELYALLLAPVLDATAQADRFKRIVVVTDGPFGEIPFGALAIDDKTRVVDRYAVSAAVSLASLLWLGGSETSKRGLLAVADPTGSISAEIDKNETRSGGYGPLPGAREEGEKIIELTRDHTLLVGLRAQESLVKRLYSDYDILHFACHGLLDSGTPLSNGLVLARNDEEDGILEVREIMVKVLSARLAVLSACDSAVGFHNGGDGVQSLVWAFLAANCENVVASRWKVNDQATRDLMVAFYTQAQANEPFDLALQSAMKKIKADPRTASPYYWAAFDVFGKPGRGLKDN